MCPWQRGAFQSMTRLVRYLRLVFLHNWILRLLWLLRYLQEDLKGWRCCCSQDAILFIVQQWLILVLHGRMHYWNPMWVSMWAPMVKHGNLGLWIAYESSCACTWCLRQMWHECDTWHIACHYSLPWWTSFACLSVCCYVSSWVDGQQVRWSDVGPSA